MNEQPKILTIFNKSTDVKKYADKNPLRFLKTETKIDAFMGGILEGDFTLLTAKTGGGKSFITIKLANEVAKNHNVAYFSLENSLQMDMSRLKDINEFSYFNLVSSGQTVDDAFAYIRTISKEKYFDIIFIDGLETLVETEDNMFQKGCNIAQELMKCSKDTPIFCCWQLNRTAQMLELKDITLAHVATSMGMATRAGTIYAIAKKQEKGVNIWQMKCLKHRCNLNNGIDDDKILEVYNNGLIGINSNNPLERLTIGQLKC